MGQRRTSLKEIAEQLGVSIATVSRALRDSHEVGEEMRIKIQALAKKLNYRPNPFAQSLKRKTPKVIGVVVPNLVTHYYAAVLDGIEDYATKSGYAVIAANSHEDHLREEKTIDNFVNMYVVGIIACLAQDTVDYSHFVEINDMGIPLVFFARTCLPEMFSSVVSNGDEAAKEATLHLIDTGSRRIAFINGPKEFEYARSRTEGYHSAMEKAGIAIDQNLIASMGPDMDYDMAKAAAMHMLSLPDSPDAFFCISDVLATAAIKASIEMGKRVPEDVAVVGFDDIQLASIMNPSITTVRQPRAQIGSLATEMLIKLIEGKDKPSSMYLGAEFIVRESARF